MGGDAALERCVQHLRSQAWAGCGHGVWAAGCHGLKCSSIDRVALQRKRIRFHMAWKAELFLAEGASCV